MSQHAADSPQRNEDEPTDPPGGDAAVRTSGEDTQPVLESGPETPSDIRVGSPFAVDPLEPNPDKPIEAFYDVGPLKYTAMGAVLASVVIVGFAAAAAYFFPAGGTMIAALGCVLSVFGMYSSFRLTAAGLLAIHLGLFVLSYGRVLNLD